MAALALLVITGIVVGAAVVSYILHGLIKRYVPAILATGAAWMILVLVINGGRQRSARRLMVDVAWAGICMAVSAYVGWWPEKGRRRERADAVRGFPVTSTEEIK